ncbi:hypothetical protein OG21DRAFT_307476 [Imleria badia]|nr:hypothetical protein OG21DRAFT_307476 [Imleria badia]
MNVCRYVYDVVISHPQTSLTDGHVALARPLVPLIHPPFSTRPDLPSPRHDVRPLRPPYQIRDSIARPNTLPPVVTVPSGEVVSADAASPQVAFRPKLTTLFYHPCQNVSPMAQPCLDLGLLMYFGPMPAVSMCSCCGCVTLNRGCIHCHLTPRPRCRPMTRRLQYNCK